ncbi:MAG: hypothetical protein HWE37_22630, partial [Rhodobacteraceae bacterium]|nr:hypothetical protein [Paracoccaceae bacterium]
MADALKNKIADVLDEPVCGTNVSKSEQQRKKGCARPLTPGAAAGGCAFDGAKIALQPIVDVAHLVHAPLACEGNGWDNRGAASSGSERYRTGFTTDMTEIDIVMGFGEKKLFRAIREVIEAEDPPAVFVYSTCVPAPASANPVHDWLARVRPPMVVDRWYDDGLLRAFERVKDWGLVQSVSRNGEWIDILPAPTTAPASRAVRPAPTGRRWPTSRAG